MFTEGIFPIGDGLLDIEEERLKRLLVPDDINEIYDVEQTPFARGKFAAVRRAVHKNSGVHFAAKFLKRRRRAQSSDKEIKHEIAVLMLCDGADNIVKLNAVHESRSDTALLLELATGGELQTFLDNEECLSEAQARVCMREVLRALQFLHKRSIAHLDLKPQNILLSGERVEDGLKLCDFGISRVVAEGTNVREIVGTPDYVAPEVLQYEPLSLLTDIWSVGVLAYVLLSGFSPFGGETKQETFLNISQCALTFPDKLFGGVSAAAIDFIRRALRIKPNDRMTAAGCLEHIWLKDECSIDRQILTGDIAKKASAAAVAPEDEHDVDEDIDVDADVDDDADDGETENDMSHDEGDESIDEEEEEEDEADDDDEISISDNNGQQNGSNKMDSSNAEEDGQPQIATNGKVTHNNGSIGSNNGINGTATKYNSNSTKSASHGKTSNGTTTTTAYVTVPAIRATTIPLQFRMMQQPLLHHYTPLAARRHSSADSNKENTFLATKKIVPAAAGHVVKKPSTLLTSTTTATTTATIIISPSEKAIAPASVVATITLPNAGHNGHSGGGVSVSSNCSSNGACLFPDAPTTPKVIRKAPTTDTSPTSVKALVKKFQLEGGSNAQKYMLHLKEAQVNQQQQQQQQHHQQQQQPPQPPHSNGLSTSTKKSPTASNGKIGSKTPDKCTAAATANGEATKKYAMANGSGRRSSEPLTAVHHKLLSSSLPSPTLSTASAPVTSYKTTCVYCTTCGSVTANNNSSSSSSANGCRHSMAANHLSNSSKVSNNNSSSSSKNSTAATNGSSSRPSTAAALLLSSQLQHHHHPHQITHHHLVAKGAAANNLSLDQGIIC